MTHYLYHAAKIGLVASLAVIAGCAGQAKAPAPHEVPQYAFWPNAPDLPRIQYLTSFNSSADLRQQRGGFREALYGKQQTQTIGISKPYGVAMWNGRIYVTDVRGAGVMVLDLRNQQVRLMGATGGGAIGRGVDIAVMPDGTKYVVDAQRRSIVVFDADERFVRSFSYRDSNPVGVAVDRDELFIVDMANQHVKVANRYTGELLHIIGSHGGGEGQFIRPLGIAVDPDGNVLVSDVITCRVQKFAPDGTFLAGFGEAGNRPGNFVRPKHLKVAGDGILYAVDAAFNNVQLFCEEQRVMMFFGSAGAHTGAMDMPAGLFITEDPGDVELFRRYIHPAFNAERLILVTNQFGPNRVAVYAMGGLREGYTLEDIAPGRIAVATE